MESAQERARVIAFYLPQFHPIPENDIWWGKGFTEWTNVAKAKPLFKNHYQPHIPADLGFYDLRLPEIREQQAEMAKYAGIEGFAYWHYWFAGKRLLETPFKEVLRLRQPNFPFCLAWANETWSGIWHGNPGKILIEQTYPAIDDYQNHFFSILEAFLDERYIKINDRCIFYIYFPFKIPDLKVFFECWNELAIKNGLKEIFFIARVNNEEEAIKAIKYGFNGVQTNWLDHAFKTVNPAQKTWNRISRKLLQNYLIKDVWDYEEIIKHLSKDIDSSKYYFPTIISGWDNSPRSGNKGRIMINYTPHNFDTHIEKVISKIHNKDFEERIIFLRSWNEWAEGNYVEPDLKYGWDFLNVLKKHLLFS